MVLLREKLESRKEVLLRFGLTLQPFVCVVGSPNNIQQCLVVVDNIQWVATSPLQALDICFITFHSLHGKYPAEARHLWLFIQRCLYKIQCDTKDYYEDKPLKTYLASYLQDFKNFLGNSGDVDA